MREFSKEEITSYLDILISKGLVWDQLDKAKELVDDPQAFYKFIKRFFSQGVLDILYTDDCLDLPLFTSATPWESVTAIWRMQHP